MHLLSYSSDLCFLTFHMVILLADECRPARQRIRAGHWQLHIYQTSLFPSFRLKSRDGYHLGLFQVLLK